MVTISDSRASVRARRKLDRPPPPARPRLRGNRVEPDAARAYFRDPTCSKDGFVHLRIGRQTLPLLSGNEPVAEFAPGWRPTGLYTGLAPLLLLEFAHDGGGRGVWFLDHRLNRIGGEVGDLPPSMLGLLRQHATPLLRRLLDQVLTSQTPSLDPRLLDFLSLDQAIRVSITQSCRDGLLPTPLVDRLDHLALQPMFFTAADGRLRAIERSRLLAALEVEWQDHQTSCLLAGRLVWPSPIDGAELQSDGSLPLDDFHILYRFTDRAAGLVFFVAIAEHEAHAVAVWFPSMNLMLSRNDHDRVAAATQVHPRLTWLVDHVVRWADVLVPYLARKASRFASVMRAYPAVHLGHQIWNELSGIDYAVRDIPDALPTWLVLGPDQGVELYGPIDQLFPELAGRVNRSLHDTAEMTGWAYRNDVFILRVTRSTVSAGLRDRIQARVRRMPATREVARVLAGRDAPGSPVILFGLRVENRTLADLGGFLRAFATYLARRYPNAMLVLDGHNARGEVAGGRVIKSHGEHGGGSPIDVERALVATLRTAMAGAPLIVLDTIGRPLSYSLAWAGACHCFVSIWGAGLAKYRWVCNKPGYVLSNRSNLTARPDLRIYDAPEYMDDPTALVMVDAALVQDDPAAPQLLPYGASQPSYVNFHVDIDHILPRIGALIDSAL